MNDITGLPNISGDMIKKGDFIWLIGVCFHAFWFVYDDEVLIFIEAFDQASIPCQEILFFIIFRIKGEGELVISLKHRLPMDSLPIDLDMFFGSQKMTNLSWDEKIIFKGLFDRHSGQGAWYRYSILHSVIVSESKGKEKMRRRKRRGETSC